MLSELSTALKGQFRNLNSGLLGFGIGFGSLNAPSSCSYDSSTTMAESAEMCYETDICQQMGNLQMRFDSTPGQLVGVRAVVKY